MWKKPDSEDLVPDFMQEAMDLFRASVVYFGTPVLAAYFLLRYHGLPFSRLPVYYLRVLSSIFGNQNLFYLLHLVPALGVRYLVSGVRLGVKGAFFIALLFDFLALLIVYPASSLLNFAVLKNICLYVALCPSLMAFFTLRIQRLHFSGGVVICIFLGLLVRGFF